jgi:putative pyruvate formate lyase activating enzyme
MRLFGSFLPFGGPAGFTPAYLCLGLEEVRRRARRAVDGLKRCRVCPRNCGVNRLNGRWSACKTGRFAVVTSAFPHLGEEDCLRGRNGSGTIFFGHCNLRCAFCQNFDISQGLPPRTAGTEPAALAGSMLRLQEMGCHNINFVTPEHVVPQLLEALVLAAEEGLRLPLVYNTSAYDSLESLRLLDGIVDIYMPDLKLFDRELCRRYLKAEDYPEVARAALSEMHRQVGPLQIGEDGLARRGILIRHLVMPGLPEETRAILKWIVQELGPDTYVNVMGQYRPGGVVGRSRHKELNRLLEPLELGSALAMARDLGLTRLDGRAPARSDG